MSLNPFKSKSSGNRGRRLGRWYVFAVVFTSLFIVGVVAWNRKPVAFSTRAVVKVGETRSPQNQDTAEALSNDAVAGSLTSIDSLREVVQQLNLISPAVTKKDPKAELMLLRSLQRSIGVTTKTTVDGQRQVVVTHVGKEKADALRVTSALVERLVDQQDEVPEAVTKGQGVIEAETRLAASVQQVNQLKQQLASFVAEHGEELSQAEIDDRDKAVVAGPDLVSPSLDDGLQRDAANTNSATISIEERQAKQERLAVLRAARDELSKTKTEIHPSIRDLTWQINQIEDELAAAQEIRAMVRKPVAVEPPTRDLIELQQAKQLQQEKEELEDKLQLAQQEQLAASAALRDAKEKSALSNTVANKKEIVESPHVVAGIGGGTSLFRVFIIGMLATMIAAVFSLLAGAPMSLPVLSSIAHARSVGLPVVATLSTHGGPELMPIKDASPAIIRWATWFCEIILVMVVILLIVVMITDAAFATLFFGSPVESLGSLFSKLQSLVGLG